MPTTQKFTIRPSLMALLADLIRKLASFVFCPNLGNTNDLALSSLEQSGTSSSLANTNLSFYIYGDRDIGVINALEIGTSGQWLIRPR